MRLWLLVFAALAALAAGCNRVYVPEGVEQLPRELLEAVPDGGVALFSDDRDGGLQEFRRRRWLDAQVWAEYLIDDLDDELRRVGAYVDPNAEHRLIISLHHWHMERSTWLRRAHVTCTVTTAEGDVVHERRYDQSGGNYRRALNGVLYRVKEGLLTDGQFLAHITP